MNAAPIDINQKKPMHLFSNEPKPYKGQFIKQFFMALLEMEISEKGNLGNIERRRIGRWEPNFQIPKD